MKDITGWKVDTFTFPTGGASQLWFRLRLASDAAMTVAWLQAHALHSPARAEQQIRFFDQYRSYVINYNLGKDLVRAYIEARGGTAEDPARRWSEFGALLSSPRLPSALLS